MTSLRAVARQAHLYVGLLLAPLLLVIGASGAFLEFEYALDRVLNPGLSYVTPSPTRASLQSLVDRVRTAYPGAAIQSLDLSPYSAAPDLAYTVQLTVPAAGPGATANTTVSLDPYTGAILGVRQGAGFAARVHEFHTELLLGARGEAVVMVMATLLVLLGLTGLVLWWPRKLFRVDWNGSPQKLNLTLHHALGSFCALFLMVFGLTGFVVYWQGSWLLPAANRALHIVDEEPALTSKPPAGPASVISLDAVDALARSRVPGARTTRIAPPAAGGVYKVWMKFPEDHTPLGRTNLLVDAYSGQILWCRTSRTAAPTTRYFRQWNRELHTGDLLGWPGRLLACAVALLLPGLAVTGPLVWWRKRQRRGVRL